MLLPSTYFAGIILLVGCLICWGSWANTLKLAKNWRFELFYYDFAFGVLLVAALAAFALGELNSKELTFTDNFLIAAKRQMAWGVVAGAVFNIANLLLVASVATGGLTLAFPIGVGLGIVEISIWSLLQNQGSVALIIGGGLVIISAIVVLCFAYSGLIDLRANAAIQVFQADPRAKKKPKKESAARPIVLGILAGLIMGCFIPLLDFARLGDAGIAPYGLGLIFAGGLFVTSLLFLPFFLNFPVQGEAIELTAYFKGKLSDHLYGFVGGAIWMAGTLCIFAVDGSPASAMVGPALRTGIPAAVPLLAALWGIFAWREFADANLRIRMLLLIMFVLFAIGAAMLALAPLHAK